MTPERWQRIRPILDRALELHGDERTAFLRERCADDAVLRADVETLLRAEARGGPPVDEPVGDYADALVEELAEAALRTGGGAFGAGLGGGSIEQPESGLAGKHIGPWRIVRELGRGGMAAVHLAERADGAYEQYVALKLLQAGPLAAELVHRFERERQILASLEHRHIARLIDGGLTNDGQPWFAMDYVEGEHIDRFCDQRRLTVDERLELFIQIARAVQAAHRALVVHRDLKPSNILVNAEGDPRLLDFGIAKLLEAEVGDTPATRTGLMLTPEYASPEQVLGDPVTTASDVYQLGLLLYELLTGVRAQRVGSRSTRELERIVVDQTPPPPSASARTGDAMAARAGARRTTTPELARRLSGDLDAIVLQALRKEPDRRYASAAGLAEDIRRHLAGLPVSARPDSLRYRAGKFVRRHALGVAAAVGIVVLTTGLVAFYTFRLQTERNVARVEAAKAEQVSDFLLQIFESSNPDEARGEELTARELLDRGVEMAEELDDQPEVQARMFEVMGYTYRRLGLYAETRDVLERALTLRREVLGPRHVDVAKSLHDLGALFERQRNYDTAEVYLQRAAALRRELLGDGDPSLAATVDELARVNLHRGRLDLAETLHREALDIRRQALGEDHEETGTSYLDLGLVLYYRDDLDGAEWHMRRGIAAYRKALGDRHPWAVGALANLALPLGAREETIDEAASLLRQVVEFNRELLGSDHPRLVVHLHNLGATLRRQGKYAEADRILAEGLEITRKRPGDLDDMLSLLLTRRGDVYLALGRARDAEAFLHEAIEVGRRAFSENHWRVADASGLLGRALVAQREFTQAEPLLLESYATIQNSEARMPYKQRAAQRLIELYEATGRPDEAARVRSSLADSVLVLGSEPEHR